MTQSAEPGLPDEPMQSPTVKSSTGTGAPSVGGPAPENAPQVESNVPAQDEDEESLPLLDKFTLLFALPSFLISLIVHIILMAVAALVVFAGPRVVQVTLEASNSEAVSVEDEINLEDLEIEDAEMMATELDNPLENVVEPTAEMPIDVTAMDMPAIPTDIGSALPSAMDMMNIPQTGQVTGQPLNHRTDQTAREQMAKSNGATAASEAAVELGLEWIAKHQLNDGGWDLNHQVGGGRFRQSPNPGQPGARLGATGLAILPFLGKGYTHQEGKYQKTVRDGLAFLIRNMKDEGVNGGSLSDARGNLYSHALGAICLCEAYGMTKDPKLLQPAAAAIKYTIYTQDPIGGGWRYSPQARGDTSALGWQLMALKSGQMMNLPLPPRVFDRATKFLNFIQADGGTEYGYLDPAPTGGPGTTAVGLLCRMYLGWGKENPTLQRAIEKLNELGPDTRQNDAAKSDTEANMYYNYYATQIMRHHGDEPWEKWNDKMRDFLVESQVKQGNAAGSWFFINGHASEVGGRLYTTSMAIMTLEVYYRHLPLYKNETMEEEFPLD